MKQNISVTQQYCYQTAHPHMQTQLNQRPRSMSAKATANRSRPISGMTTKTIVLPSSKTLKTQLITSIYQQPKQKSPSRRNSSKNLLYQGISTQELIKYKKSTFVPVNKSKQELYQQNIQLKKQINKMSEELSIVKGKWEVKSKKAVSKKKQLDMEFEKEVFWGGTRAHMIEGIKYQYEKLKKQHQQQTIMFNQLKKSLLQSKIPQYKIYSQAVQAENRRLSDKLKKMLQAQDAALKNTFPDKQVSQTLAAAAEQNCRILQEKLIQLDIQLRNANESLKDKDKKIQFLQKLIIEKDNKQFHIGRKLKKTQKIKQQLQCDVTQLNGIIHRKQKQWQATQKNINHKNREQNQKIHNKYTGQISQLRHRIRELEEENKFLENTVNKLRMSSSAVVNNSSIGGMAGNKSSTNPGSAPNTVRKTASPIIQVGRSKQGKLDNYDSVLSKALEQNSQKQEDRPRSPQKADKKHSEHSKKMRKVQFAQVQQIGEILKYRMLNQNIEPQQLKKYFDFNPKLTGQFVLDEKDDLSEEEKEWKKTYIDMAEVIKILKKAPFSLDDQNCMLLARYIIEDCLEQYVYCDYGNENNRDIAKSILKTVIGQYKLPSQQIKQKAQTFMQKYETNLQSALRTYYPAGKVSKRKFLDTINGLGVEVSEQVAEYLLTVASRGCKSLQEVEYGILFNKISK